MKRKFFIKFLCIGLTLGMMLTGCANTSGQSSVPETSDNGKTYAISFVDDDGIQINMEKPAERIMSLYSAHTENLFSLDAGDKVIGGHTTCVYPPEAASMATYDYSGDPEQIIAANPDLVLIRPFIRRKSPDFVTELERAGLLVVSLYPESYDDFTDYINKLAMITGKEDVAKQKLEDFYNSIDAITAVTANVPDKQTVFFESTEVNIRTIAAGTMPDRAITFAGGLNLAANQEPMTPGSSIAEFGVEKVLEHADDIDVYISQRGAMNAGGNLISIGERAGYDTIKAVQNNRVYLINEKLISSPTFRYYKGVHEVARYLYPDLIDDVSSYQNDELATKVGFADMIVRSLHLPIYTPTSSKYYLNDIKGHAFGLFEDVKWSDDAFDYVETAVYAGYVGWEKGNDDKEYFYPSANVTREDLAKSIFLMGDFKNQNNNTPIADLDTCEKQNIVQILVDNGVFELNNGKFEPERPVTNQEILNALEFVK